MLFIPSCVTKSSANDRNQERLRKGIPNKNENEKERQATEGRDSPSGLHISCVGTHLLVTLTLHSRHDIRLPWVIAAILTAAAACYLKREEQGIPLRGS